MMSHINFRNLTLLNLQCNNIVNIESLAFMNSPHLSHIDLGSNYVC